MVHYRVHKDPARATMLTLSPNETVTDLASMLKFADSLLRLARFCCCCATELFVTSACTSNLHSKPSTHSVANLQSSMINNTPVHRRWSIVTYFFYGTKFTFLHNCILQFMCVTVIFGIWNSRTFKHFTSTSTTVFKNHASLTANWQYAFMIQLNE